MLVTFVCLLDILLLSFFRFARIVEDSVGRVIEGELNSLYGTVTWKDGCQQYWSVRQTEEMSFSPPSEVEAFHSILLLTHTQWLPS